MTCPPRKRLKNYKQKHRSRPGVLRKINLMPARWHSLRDLAEFVNRFD